MEFQAFPKLSRLFKMTGCTITEKIDGTNAGIYIDSEGNIKAASRNKFITPEDDNYGFAKWVVANKDELLKLGPGVHHGEWWGHGIQRGYGVDSKRFSLFNVQRWGRPDVVLPACVGLVPILARGEFSKEFVASTMTNLKTDGSHVAPGFMNPEGVVIHIHGTDMLIKETFEYNEGKWKAQQQQGV